MRKLFILLTSIILITTSCSSSEAQDNIKDYTITKKPCPRSKVNQENNNKICIKTGKVYRWAIKNIEQSLNNSTTPSINLNKSLSTLNINNFNNNDIWIKSNYIIDNYESKYNTKINFIVSPNVNKNRIKEQEDLLIKSINLWSKVHKPSDITPWYFVYEDSQWLKLNIKRSNIINEVMGHYFNDSNKCFFGGTWNTLENNIWISQNEMYFCIGNGSEDSFYNHNVGHEYVHVVQGYTAFRKNLPKPYNYQLMCWAFEGMPTFYGIATADFDDKNRINFYKSSISGEFKKIISSESKIKQWFKDNEVSIPNCPGKNSDIYVAGSLATELLVATNGHDAVMQFHVDLGLGKSWQEAFNKNFNISTDNFYDIVSKYIYNFYNGL